MAKGPQKYPGATLNHWFQGRYPGVQFEANCGVIHVTEGPTLYDYDGGGVAPTITALPDIGGKRLRWYQHYDVDRSARALVNKPGGVDTNTANAVQIELVGTCDPKNRATWRLGSRTYKAGVDYIYWPAAPDWALRDLAAFLRWCRDEHGIQLQGPDRWLPYPASYGATSARMSFAQWRGFLGWCGHQHVPENDHGDPGDIDFARLLAMAKGTDTPAKPDDKESDMDPHDVWRVELEIPAADGKPPHKAETGQWLKYGNRKAEQAQAAAEAALAEAKAARAAAEAAVAKLDQVLAKLTAGGAQ